MRWMQQNAVAGKLALTVSQLNEYIRRTLQTDPMLRGIELRGEVSNLKFHQTGTLFFTLKDESAAISCVMYERDVYNLQSMPFEGMRAVVSGSVSLYVRGGQMQFYVTALHAQGVGVLYERLQILKTKLAAQGLFDSEKKRSLPAVPDTIGVVSSPTGAVIHDIIQVASRRDPQVRILLCPVQVQGVGAAEQVVDALRLLEQMESVSVIIVARGGGSMEDLWTFNEEAVVRAVAACRKPVVSAIGHETDVTLCDLAADLRAPTPSAAAECVVPVRRDIERRLDELRVMLCREMQALLSQKQAELNYYASIMERMKPARQYEYAEQRFARTVEMMRDGMKRTIHRYTQCLDQRSRELEMLSPYRILSRGYAIVEKDGIPVKSSAQVQQGDRLAIRWTDGAAVAQVTSQPVQEEGK